MSRPGFAADNASPGPAVTVTVPNYCDGDNSSSHSDNLHSSSFSHHHHDDRQLPSPFSPEELELHKNPSGISRSPNPTQSIKSTQNSTLKRARTIPFDEARHPVTVSSHHSPSPQLSERESIFATHYLPSDSDASSTPWLTPVGDVDLERSVTGPQAVHASRDARLSIPPAPSRLSAIQVVPLEPEGAVSARPNPIDDPPDHQTSRSHSISFRRASETPWQSAAVTRSGSHLGWVRRQEPVESSTVAGKHRIAIRETFHPQRKGTAEIRRGDPAVRRDTQTSPLATLLVGSSSSSTLSLASHDAPPIMRPSFPDQECLLEEPWSAGPPLLHKHGDVFDVDWETRVERNASRGRSTRVEESIEANLTNTDPSAHVRSRKSSHYMGLFKENTTSPEPRRRDNRAAEAVEVLEAADGEDTSHDEDGPPEPSTLQPLQRTNGQTCESTDDPSAYPSRGRTNDRVDFVENAVDISGSRSTASDLEDSQSRLPSTLPHALLEDIRNLHLTTGGGRGGSFSQSIPTQIPSERSGHAFTAEKLPGPESGDRADGFHSLGEETVPGGAEAEYDDENEHISSALYFPYEPKSHVESEDLTVSDEAKHIESPGTAIPRQTYPASAESGYTKHVRSRHDGNLPLADLPQLSETDDNSLATISEHSHDLLSDSDVTSTNESVRSAKDEESSLTDEMDVTPTQTPAEPARVNRSRRKYHTQTGAIGAVELKPYRHQVGGHTTVFRFSRRAVCKQLNNRENEFYERIERRHPEMLMFLPRYLGVLNVTFSKNPKRPTTRSIDGPENADTQLEGDKGATHPAKRNERTTSQAASHVSREPQASRIFSQQQVTGVIPKVILANNRHIIPSDLFLPPRPKTADGERRSKSVATSARAASDNRQDSNALLESPVMPSPVKKQTNRWGATMVNRKLQEQVLREVFSPPPIHHHNRRPGRHHLSLPRNHSDMARHPVNQSEGTPRSRQPLSCSKTASSRTGAIDIVKNTNDSAGLSSSISGTIEQHSNPLEKVRSGMSPADTASSKDRPLRRRHSGSGLVRRRNITGSDGDLVFYDDDGYRGDHEDAIFAMENDSALSTAHPTKAAYSPDSSRSEQPLTTPSRSVPDLLRPLPVAEPEGLLVPKNPKEAQTKRDERVQFFILLEDLTAGMNKPCVLDLKMGTRQYGLEADEKKKKSQRRKCQSTTSQQLGVRLCGMQTWNVKKQEYLFEDKYYGRDLKAGREFQDALTRFLYDGVSYRSVTKKIPIILEKLALLESMIRRLKGYRFYASSLLILYDGEQQSASTNPKVDYHGNGTKQPRLRRKASTDSYKPPDVQLKIVDFANCLTGEDELPPNVPCPPHHPDDVDRGYLRGLRSLRMYFQRILREVSQEDYVERGEGEVIDPDIRSTTQKIPFNEFWDENIVESDPGEVSM